MRYRVLVGAAALYLCAANIIWITRDNRPPFWDMAAHQVTAIRIYDAVHNDGLSGFLAIPKLTGFYPPLFHSVVALFYVLFGRSSHVGQLANLPAIALLLFATYAIGRRLMSHMAAAASAILVGFYPILVWISRETIIDYWLTSLVALAMLCLLRTESFSKRSESALFGVVCGLGMLTKWTFGMFLALPFLWAARKNWKNGLLSAVIAIFLSAFWYLPQWRSIVTFFSENTSGGVAEGDPGRLSWQALVYYVRAMEGYQLFLPLFVLFVAGVIFLARHHSADWLPVTLWIIGGWCGLFFFQNKDPRYSAPFLPAVALISATIFQRRERWLPVLFVFLIFQHQMISFGNRFLPERIVLLKGIEGPLSWHWNLYSQTYFQLLGPPAQEDWKIEHVLASIARVHGPTVRLGIIPSIPRFDPQAFEFYSTLRGYPVVINQLWFFDEKALVAEDYILMSETDQGHAAFYSHDLGRINQYIFDRPGCFQMVERFSIPGGQTIRLYKSRPS